MNISAYVRFTLKNKPDEYRGITGEDWNIGKDDPLEWHQLVYIFVRRVVEFYVRTCNPDPREFSKQAKDLSDALGSMEIVEKKISG